MKTPRCKRRACPWRGNPTDDKEGAQSQIDEHMAATHPVVTEVGDADVAGVQEQEA